MILIRAFLRRFFFPNSSLHLCFVTDACIPLDSLIRKKKTWHQPNRCTQQLRQFLGRRSSDWSHGERAALLERAHSGKHSVYGYMWTMQMLCFFFLSLYHFMFAIVCIFLVLEGFIFVLKIWLIVWIFPGAAVCVHAPSGAVLGSLAHCPEYRKSSHWSRCSSATSASQVMTIAWVISGMLMT